MIATSTVNWSEILSNPLQLAVLVYIFVGFGIAGFIAARGWKLRRPPNNGPLWDKRDNARNELFLFQSIALLSLPIFLLEVALWPLVLLYLWAFQADDDD
jgi:hypothetical protein